MKNTLLILLLTSTVANLAYSLTVPVSGGGGNVTITGNSLINELNQPGTTTYIDGSKIDNDDDFKDKVKIATQHCPADSDPGDCLYTLSYMRAIIVAVEDDDFVTNGTLTTNSDFTFALTLDPDPASPETHLDFEIEFQQRIEYTSGTTPPTSCSDQTAAITEIRDELLVAIGEAEVFFEDQTSVTLTTPELALTPTSTCDVVAVLQPATSTLPSNTGINQLVYLKDILEDDVTTDGDQIFFRGFRKYEAGVKLENIKTISSDLPPSYTP